jgi:hypothetical protein
VKPIFAVNQMIIVWISLSVKDSWLMCAGTDTFHAVSGVTMLATSFRYRRWLGWRQTALLPKLLVICY